MERVREMRSPGVADVVPFELELGQAAVDCECLSQSLGARGFDAIELQIECGQGGVVLECVRQQRRPSIANGGLT